MSEAPEKQEQARGKSAEKAEDASRLGTYVGITMALLGVLMALCGSRLGIAQTRLITTMVKQAAATNRHQAVATKYRLMESQLRSTHAFIQNDPEQAKKTEGKIDDIEKAANGAPIAPAIGVMRLETANLMDAILPNVGDMISMAKTTARYGAEEAAAREWADSFDDEISIFGKMCASYGNALLVAQIAVIVASVALLLGSRGAWLASCAAGVFSVFLAASEFVTSAQPLADASAKVESSTQKYVAASNEELDRAEDKKLLDETLSMPH